MKIRGLLFTAILVLSYSGYAGAQDRDSSFFQFSVCPRLGTNGRFEGMSTNRLSINLTSGILLNEKGFAIAGVSNSIKNDASGMQVAGVFNRIKGSASGVQVAGVANVAGDVRGLQIACAVNTAKSMNGAQIGVVNVAGNVKGVQVGFVNVSDDGDVPVGLVNIIKNGEMGLSLNYDAFGNLCALFRSGGKYTYGILGVGYNLNIAQQAGSGPSGSDAVMAECGLGAHIPCVEWFRVNNEMSVRTIGTSSEKPVWTASYRLMPAFKVIRHLEIFGGAELGYLFTDNAPYAEILSRNTLTITGKGTDRLYLGWAAGISFLF